MPAPVRPVFQNGQRLTADRLTQALEYLRSWIRRLSLGPLSSGVAAGLTLEPFGNSRGLIVQPGLAIDGRGRLLLLSEPQVFTPDDLAAQIGSVGPGTVIRVRLAILDGGASADPCAGTSPTVVEDVQILLDRTATPQVTANQPEFNPPLHCVSPQDPLDLDVGTDCTVTLGHVLGQTGGALAVAYTERQGVSPQLGVIRNQLGTPSIALGQMVIEFDGINNAVEGVAVGRPALFTQPARFLQRSIFEDLGGASVQATRVAFVGKNYSAGSPWGDDGRIFVFPGGAGDLNDEVQQSDVPAGRGGLAAVPCQVISTSTSIPRAGIALEIADPNGTIVQVRRARTTSGISFSDTLIGLSAKKQASFGSVVPVAVSGLIKVTVRVGHDAIALGAPLTVNEDDSSELVLAGSEFQYALARAAQSIPGNGVDGSGTQITTAQSILAWVVHPPVRNFAVFSA